MVVRRRDKRGRYYYYDKERKRFASKEAWEKSKAKRKTKKGDKPTKKKRKGGGGLRIQKTKNGYKDAATGRFVSKAEYQAQFDEKGRFVDSQTFQAVREKIQEQKEETGVYAEPGQIDEWQDVAEEIGTVPDKRKEELKGIPLPRNYWDLTKMALERREASPDKWEYRMILPGNKAFHTYSDEEAIEIFQDLGWAINQAIDELGEDPAYDIGQSPLIQFEVAEDRFPEGGGRAMVDLNVPSFVQEIEGPIVETYTQYFKNLHG